MHQVLHPRAEGTVTAVERRCIVAAQIEKPADRRRTHPTTPAVDEHDAARLRAKILHALHHGRKLRSDK